MLESVIPGDNEKKSKGEGGEGVVLSINETRVDSRGRKILEDCCCAIITITITWCFNFVLLSFLANKGCSKMHVVWRCLERESRNELCFGESGGREVEGEEERSLSLFARRGGGGMRSERGK